MLMEAAASVAPGGRPDTSACLTCPTAVAGVLLRDGGLAPAEMGRFLCGAGAARLGPALAALVRSLDLAFRPLDEALRALLAIVELPAETGEPRLNWPTSPTAGVRRLPAASAAGAAQMAGPAPGSGAETGSTSWDPLPHALDSEGASGGGFFEASGGASTVGVARASGAACDELYDGARVAVRLLAEHFFACNQASLGGVHGWPSVDVLFAVAMQLIATSRRVSASGTSGTGTASPSPSPSKSGSPASKAVDAALQALLEREWASFHGSCQDASFALAGRRLPEERLKPVFRRVAERPFAVSGPEGREWAEGLAFDDLDLPSSSSSSSSSGGGGGGASSIAESSEISSSNSSSIAGYLWLLASPPAGRPSGGGAGRVLKRSETPAGVSSPPWLGRRLWVVLRGWVLYLFSEAPFPERGELIAVMPLGDAVPQLRHVCVELSGHLKVAQGGGGARVAAPASASSGGFLKRLLLGLQGGADKGSVGGSGLLELRDLVMRAQSEAEAGRWYLALTRARTTPQADADAGFAQQVSTKAAKRLFWRLPVKPGARRDDRSGSEGAEDEGEASARSGRRSASPASRSSNEQCALPSKATLVVSMSGILHVNLRVRVVVQDQKRRAGALQSKASYERWLCTLIGRRLVLAAEGLSPKSGGSSGGRTDRAVDLMDLSIVVPSTDRFRPELGAFRFELISAEERSIAICAAPTLKEYAQWFKALSSLSPSAQQRIYLDDPNASPRSLGSDSGHEDGYATSAPLRYAARDSCSSSDEDAATADGSLLEVDSPRSRLVQADQLLEAGPGHSQYPLRQAPEQAREHAPSPSNSLDLPAVTAARDLLARLAMLGLEAPAFVPAAPRGAEPPGTPPLSRAAVSIDQESAAPRGRSPTPATRAPVPRPASPGPAARAAALLAGVRPPPPRIYGPPGHEQQQSQHPLDDEQQRQQGQAPVLRGFPAAPTSTAPAMPSYLLPAFFASAVAPPEPSAGAPPRSPPLQVDEPLTAASAEAARAGYLRALEQGKEWQDFFSSRPVPARQAPEAAGVPASVSAPSLGPAPPPPPPPPPQRHHVSEQEQQEQRPRQEPRQRQRHGATLLQRPRMFRVDEPSQRGQVEQALRESPRRQQEPPPAADEGDGEVFEDAHQPAAPLRGAKPPAAAPPSPPPAPAAAREVTTSPAARKPRRAPPPEPVLTELSPPPPPPPPSARRGAPGSSTP